MGRRKNENIRKIQQIKEGSYYITIPIDVMRELGWKEAQKVVVKKRGEGISIVDWSPTRREKKK